MLWTVPLNGQEDNVPNIARTSIPPPPSHATYVHVDPRYSMVLVSRATWRYYYFLQRRALPRTMPLVSRRRARHQERSPTSNGLMYHDQPNWLRCLFDVQRRLVLESSVVWRWRVPPPTHTPGLALFVMHRRPTISGWNAENIVPPSPALLWYTYAGFSMVY